MSEVPAPRYGVPEGDLAIILNANAGRVRRQLARTVQATLPGATIFWTRSLDEADDAIEAILESEFGTVFAGGGDGTIIDVVGRLLRYKRSPRLGILRLGTGNALATWVGARSVREDLQAWARGDVLREMPMRLMHADGELFPFAGLGWDAAVLNDYRQLKHQMEATPLKSISHQVWVYLAAAFGRTVPRIALEREPPQVRVVVTRGQAWRVDIQGERIDDPVPSGEVLYEGPAHMLGFGTTPYYGYAIRIFPHAERNTTHMHLRVSAMDVSTVVNELHRLWTGELSHPRLYDFLAESVRVEFDREVPYQVGGDARGHRDRIEVAVSPLAMSVVSFG